MEEEGSLYWQFANEGPTPVGDPYTDSVLAEQLNPATYVHLYWSTTGSVSLTRADGNTALLLQHPNGQSSSVEPIAPVILAARPSTLAFDLGVSDAGAGDVLQVLVNGTVWQTIDLTTVPSQSHQLFPLNGVVSDAGAFTFRFSGPDTSAGVITLDNIAILSGNHAPALAPAQPGAADYCEYDFRC